MRGSNRAKGLQGSVTGVPAGSSQVRVGVVMVRGIQLPVSVVIYIFFDNNNVNMCRLFVCSLAQSYPTLCDPMDCSPPSSSCRGDSPGRNTGVFWHSLLQIACIVINEYILE